MVPLAFSVVQNYFRGSLQGETYAMPEKRPPGRPKGETSTIINLRLPLALLARLDRYIDRRESTAGVSTNRGTILRNALRAFLEAEGY